MADFDAVASLLGAYLLDEGAYPVLPHHLNRNVRSFLTLYGLELPFVENKDLPRKDVSQITLVDTQSLVTPRGMTEDTHIHVIDHHPLKDDLPPDWQVITEDTGATVTLLVESLQQQNGHLSQVYATLLLLGIYEDTGSLTFGRTTPRDVRAAAWLLENGADLNLAVRFLNQPLSDGQLTLYHQLQDAAVSHSINGQTITIACGDASGLDEELSTIAHRMRDFLDTDAIFLIIQIKNGLQLIARSTTDAINVGVVAEKLGGGGHTRAAAAHINDVTIDEVHNRLLEILPEVVQSARTVAELMSEGPRVISPDASIKEASALMQRYGYEGFPVVKNEHVIGLLTRRSVDRAISHKLNLTAADIMEPGSVQIYPSDTVEALQELMTETGWGQIPVADPDSDQIIGIVTRTDLLKTLSPKNNAPRQLNLANRLEQALPPGRLALLKEIATIAQEEKQALYIVGGFVRDILLEIPGLDFDLVVEGDAIELSRHLVGAFGGRLQKHKRFGTAKWIIGGVRQKIAAKLSAGTGQSINPEDLPESLDLVTARREFYTHPTALPTVERGNIKLDLHRRDFTINTLALRLDGRHYGELHDHWGGLDDLDKGLVRVLHSLSFVDDPTRILRAVRFAQRFGFSIEERTSQLLDNALPLIKRVSGDRLRHEFNRILEEHNPMDMLEQLSELGVLNAIHPALQWNKRSRQRFSLANLEIDPAPFKLKSPIGSYTLEQAVQYILWLMDNTEEELEEIGSRLRFSGWLLEAAVAAEKLHRQIPELLNRKPSQVCRVLEHFPALAMYVVVVISTPDENDLLLRYLKEWNQVKPFTTGKELRLRGYKPGPFFSRVLDRLIAAWLDGEISTADEEQVLLEKILAEMGSK